VPTLGSFCTGGFRAEVGTIWHPEALFSLPARRRHGILRHIGGFDDGILWHIAHPIREGLRAD
jgi:hypothetical protein